MGERERGSSCPPKIHSAQMCQRCNWGINALKLQKKERVASLTSSETAIFKPRILYVLYWQVYSIVLKSMNLIKEKVFPSVTLFENIKILVHTVNNRQRSVDWHRGHWSFSRWTVWSCCRSRTLYKWFIQIAFAREFSKLGGWLWLVVMPLLHMELASSENHHKPHNIRPRFNNYSI